MWNCVVLQAPVEASTGKHNLFSLSGSPTTSANQASKPYRQQSLAGQEHHTKTTTRRIVYRKGTTTATHKSQLRNLSVTTSRRQLQNHIAVPTNRVRTQAKTSDT